MTTTPIDAATSGHAGHEGHAGHAGDQLDASGLAAKARDHLWMHFTRQSTHVENPVPTIVRGDGPWIYDITGKRYLDGLAGLFAVQIGYGYGEEVGEAAAAQLAELPFYTNWSYAHPRAIELAEEVAIFRQGDVAHVVAVLVRERPPAELEALALAAITAAAAKGAPAGAGTAG